MAQTAAVVGNGPVAYFTDDGRRVLFPLSEFYFDGGEIKTRTTPLAPGALANWLNYLVAQGRLVPGEAPGPGSAMVFTASAAGSTGNNIVVTVVPNGAAVDITITVKDAYEGLTLDPASPNFVEKVLGTTTTPGTLPGLVVVDTTIPADAPDPDLAAPAAIALVGAIPTMKILGLPTAAGGAATTSFTLKARGDFSAPITLWAVEVSNLQQPAAAGARKTFTLTVTWEKTVTAVTTDAAAITAFQTAVKFAVAIEEPTSGAGFKLPRPGSFKLRGGAETKLATKAKTTLLANT